MDQLIKTNYSTIVYTNITLLVKGDLIIHNDVIYKVLNQTLMRRDHSMRTIQLNVQNIKDDNDIKNLDFRFNIPMYTMIKVLSPVYEFKI